MSTIALNITRKFWPEIDQLPEEIRISGVANVLSVIYSTPIAAAGLIWLISESNLEVVRNNWWMFLLIAGLMYALERLSFFVTIETGNGRYLSSEGSLDTVMLWSAIFLFGHIAIWLGIIFLIINFVELWSASHSASDRWNSLRNLTLAGAADTIGILVSLLVYQSLGGNFPIQGLDPKFVIPALVALFVNTSLILILWSGFIIYILFNRGSLFANNSSTPVIRLILLAIALPNLANPFSILAAGLYAHNTFFMFAFLTIGILLVAILARKLSTEAEMSRQRARQLEKLETLGEKIINSSPDASNLPEILQEIVPGMFPGRVAIWISPDQLLLRHPIDWEIDIEAVNNWLSDINSAESFTEKDKLPWNSDTKTTRPTVVCPIYDVEAEGNIGGIYVETRRVLPPWGLKELEGLYPPLYSLASQITSALHRAERYLQTLEYHRLSQELNLAGRIQASFLPNRMPDLPGWQLAVTLLPARATSGDFFDFIPLDNGKIAIVIADVADKGIGPALYMALSRTLLRTFATQYSAEPEKVISQTNKRILSDARAHLFVTLFYGILDWKTGKLVYCNAGHNPPFILNNSSDRNFITLSKTGIPVGIDEDAEWETHHLDVFPGDVLILYTDGITEAQNQNGEFFDEDLLFEAAEAHFGEPAYEIQSSILESLQTFVGGYTQDDDITLMILARDTIQSD